MKLFQTNEYGVASALKRALHDVRAASPSEYNKTRPFIKNYGPGIEGFHKDGKGTFCIEAFRYNDNVLEYDITIRVAIALASADYSSKKILLGEDHVTRMVKRTLSNNGGRVLYYGPAEISTPGPKQ